MQSIGKIIAHRRAAAGSLGRQITAAKIVALANQQLVKNYPGSQAAYFRSGVLTIMTESTVAIQALKLHEAEFLKQLNQAIEAPLIKKLSFKPATDTGSGLLNSLPYDTVDSFE